MALAAALLLITRNLGPAPAALLITLPLRPAPAARLITTLALAAWLPIPTLLPVAARTTAAALPALGPLTPTPARGAGLVVEAQRQRDPVAGHVHLQHLDP